MKKTVLAAASCKEQKYYIAKEFEVLPSEIKDEIKITCVLIAQKLFCTFVIGFLEEGDIYFDIVKEESELDFDDIGAELEIKEIRKKKKELLNALKLWYVVFQTKEGEKIVEKLIRNE